MASYEDVNGDSFIDIVIHVATKELNLTLGSTKAELKGYLLDGIEIKGSDSVRMIVT